MARSLYLFQTAVLGCAACNKNEAMHLRCLASPFDAAPRAPDCINVRLYETDEGEPTPGETPTPEHGASKRPAEV